MPGKMNAQAYWRYGARNSRTDAKESLNATAATPAQIPTTAPAVINTSRSSKRKNFA